MSNFERIQIVPINSPVITIGKSSSNQAIKYCESARNAGINEVQANFLITPFHSILMEDPGKVYHWFSHYAPSLDQFAASKLFREVYLQPLIEMNFQWMEAIASEASKQKLTPFLYCAEPRFVPERFFARHPELRGPRVDNPRHGAMPYYALCTDREEVRRHYSEMLENIMARIPQLGALSIFTCDSGSGFCYVDNLYAGSNGPGHCRNTAVEDRISNFCKGLLETGRKFKPSFEVHLNSSLTTEERRNIAGKNIKGVQLPVYGLYSWTGGLEDQWAYHQYRSKIQQVGYEKAREERFKEIRERVEDIKSSNAEPWAICDFPTNQYFLPLRYVPQPFEILRILRQYKSLGIRHLSLRGVLNEIDNVPYDVNAGVIAESQKNGLNRTDDDILKSIVKKWSCPSIINGLTKAWQLADESVRERPLWNHCFGRETRMAIGPLVPNPGGLTVQEKSYYYHIFYNELDRIKGAYYYLPHLPDKEEYTYALKKYQAHTLPLLIKSSDVLSRIKCNSEKEKDVVECQRKFIGLLESHIRSQYHWLQMGFIMQFGRQTKGDFTMTPEEIVKAEIKNTGLFKGLIGKDTDSSLLLSPVEGCMYSIGPRLLEQLELRMEIMKKHCKDSPVKLINKR